MMLWNGNRPGLVETIIVTVEIQTTLPSPQLDLVSTIRPASTSVLRPLGRRNKTVTASIVDWRSA